MTDTASTVQLSDDLRKEAITLAKKIAAFSGSSGDSAVMESYKDPPSYVTLAGITLVLGAIAIIFAEVGNYYEIKQNWPYYQCQPSIAPFAKLYGHDPIETMNFCVGQAVKNHSAGVIDPIYKGISEVTGKVDTVITKVESAGKGVEGLLAQFGKFVAGFVNSLRLVGVRIQMMVVMVKEIFQRIFAIFIAFAYAAISAITFGENLICNPLVTFVAGIAGVDICCFAPDTRVRMADGSTQDIVDVQIGDRLVDGGKVISRYTFAGVPDMWSVRGVVVSGNHYLRDPSDKRWIRADAHPDAVRAPALHRIYCLGTDNNRIPIAVPNSADTLTFTDYEESSDPAVIAAAQAAVETVLNGHVGPTIEDYSLGLHPNALVFMATGSWKRMVDLRVGDELAGGARVAGVIHEVCESVCHGGVSAAQLLLVDGEWIRAGNIWPVEEKEGNVFVQVLTTRNQPFLVMWEGETMCVRDYAESMEAEEPYLAALSKS